MFRRIALTLGTGAAMYSAATLCVAAGQTAANSVTNATAASSLTTVQVVAQRSGYIVASS